ncbi:MAG: hypothetical protein ACFFD1_04930 [Candidatus Thorarchaeota archaeon]
MNIIYEFRVDERELNKCKKMGSLLNVDQTSLAHCYFYFPVRLYINGFEFFGYINPSDPYLTCPLIGISTTGIGVLRALATSHEVLWHIPERPQAKFIRTGNLLTIHYRKTILKADYDQLLTAFKQFESSVKHFFHDQFPDLCMHTYWGPWLKNEAIYTIDQGLVPSNEFDTQYHE